MNRGDARCSFAPQGHPMPAQGNALVGKQNANQSPLKGRPNDAVAEQSRTSYPSHDEALPPAAPAGHRGTLPADESYCTHEHSPVKRGRVFPEIFFFGMTAESWVSPVWGVFRAAPVAERAGAGKDQGVARHRRGNRAAA